jgi:signal transduction histidine kinase
MFNQAKNASLGEMINMITHQWRQPLSSITALASKLKLLAQTDRTEPKQIEGEMEQIITASRYLSLTIEDFKNFFIPDTAKRKTSLGEVIEEALKFSDHPLALARIEVRREIRNKDETVWLYKNELIQVLMNLIKNSIDQVAETKTANGRIEVACDLRGQKAHITITDNAGGIDATILPHIFDEYTTGKNEGTGLGLYMSRMIMTQRMNGSIEAENIVSENGERGARFTLTLPL